MGINKYYLVPFSRQAVFEAWVSPETVIPPVTKVEIDPRVGGSLKLLVESPDSTSTMTGKFKVVEPLEKLVYTWEWDKSGEFTTATVTLNETEKGTKININHSGFSHEKSRFTHDARWDSYVEGMVQLLAKT